MGLHTIVTNKLQVPVDAFDFQEEPEEDYDNEENGQCQTCGTHSWSRMVYGRYSQQGFYTFGHSRHIDYDSMSDEEQDDADDWECENGHSASAYISEMLGDV